MDATKTKVFPYEILDLESELNDKVTSLYKGHTSGFVRVGPKGYLFPKRYELEAVNLYNLPIRPSDVFVVSSPRSGTTWVQELVWLIANGLNYDKALAVPLPARFFFIEVSAFYDPITIKKIQEDLGDEQKALIARRTAALGPEHVAQLPSPRFIKSHLPFSLLPPTLLDTAKVVYIARDPRDVAVSFYHHNRLIKFHEFTGDFRTYWDLFINDLILYMPFFEAVKEAWDKRNHPNMLFLFYEELIKDLPAVVRRVSSFLGEPLTPAQVDRLCEHLSFDSFKKNKSVNLDSLDTLGLAKSGEEPFIRKGKSGGWRDYFDAEMRAKAQRWMEHNLRDTDLRFPEIQIT